MNAFADQMPDGSIAAIDKRARLDTGDQYSSVGSLVITRLMLPGGISLHLGSRRKIEERLSVMLALREHIAFRMSKPPLWRAS